MKTYRDCARCWPFRRCCRAFGVPLLALTLVSTGAGSAAAHALVTWSSLQDHPVPVRTPTDAVLRFNAGIELKFTQVLLVDAEGGERPLAFAPGPAPGELVVKLPPLAPGAYALRYKVLASDGHLTENVVRFRVSAPR